MSLYKEIQMNNFDKKIKLTDVMKDNKRFKEYSVEQDILYCVQK